jgi:CheY-like chemotaxis protein
MSANVVSLSAAAQPRRRVLLVEDNLDSVHSMATMLKMMGHDVEFAVNGLGAIDAARRFRPEIILLDIGLPDFRGDRIARQLRYEPGLERTRVVAMTGLPLDVVKPRALEAGCEDVYVKPLAPQLLEELLAK